MCMNLSPDAERKIAALTALLQSVGAGSAEDVLGPEPFVDGHDAPPAKTERPSLTALRGKKS